MTLFGFNFIESQLHLNNFIKYFITIILVLILILAITLYIRHRIQIKYRDLSIIVFLLLLFMLGLQYSDYAISKNQHNQSFQLLNFISNVSKERHLDKSKILVSSMQLNNGVIIKIKNTYYQVNLSTDQNSYTLTKTHLMNDQIIIKK